MGNEMGSLQCCSKNIGTPANDALPGDFPTLLKGSRSPPNTKEIVKNIVADNLGEEDEEVSIEANSTVESLLGRLQLDELAEDSVEYIERSERRKPTAAEAMLLRQARKRWTLEHEALERVRKTTEYQVLLEQTRAQTIGAIQGPDNLPANRYGVDARLPAFEEGTHVPVIALINPWSGAMAGADILAIARQTPYYQNRFFNIIDVVKDGRRGGLLDVFRIELCRVKDEAKKMSMRPRIISGGGDGTASFALYIIFSALRADPAICDDGFPDKGNGFIWTDDEMAEHFPALAQMPLGSANDFGHSLGWGQKYPGDAESRGIGCGRRRALEGLRIWISSVLDPSMTVANFDVFGIVPLDGEDTCDFKLAELTGRRGLNPKVDVDGQEQLVMKEAGLPVPLFVCLYFSAGMAAYMTARFQINRRRTPVQNKFEYARQAVGIVSERLPPQLHAGLEAVEVSCLSEGRSETYFPPRREKGNTSRHYRDVGFLNINWQAGMLHGRDRAPLYGRLCSSREPAKFNDGEVDMYRLKLKSAIKSPGLNIQTDKRQGGMTLIHEGSRGKGVFFQWDGEARFAFSPSGDPFHIDVRKILNIPVVLGPKYDPKVTGDPDNGLPVRFSFGGNTREQQQRFRQRILRGVRGELNAELIATREEMLTANVPCEEPR